MERLWIDGSLPSRKSINSNWRNIGHDVVPKITRKRKLIEGKNSVNCFPPPPSGCFLGWNFCFRFLFWNFQCFIGSCLVRSNPKAVVIFVAITLYSIYNSLNPFVGVLKKFAPSSVTKPACTVIFQFKVWIRMSSSPQTWAKDLSLREFFLHGISSLGSKISWFSSFLLPSPFLLLSSCPLLPLPFLFSPSFPLHFCLLLHFFCLPLLFLFPH